ncbi:centromere-associated protein E isoform X1 [Cucumis melo var. makuwa]|uniref:Centromere-associated protein E isoform X1 n=1 Tax=Cucumis melo var. makuwa TaxID=1194695 RepID=A0A5D3DPF7_CUCMM|nr:centromere-associated protein E isoform X1 [Cucumis melo var. makuwa]
MERIHVTVRARPLSAADSNTSPWKISGNSIFIPNNPNKFEFGKFPFISLLYPSLLLPQFSPPNWTVFAYGQTNSGKTHTMRGSPTEPGIIPLAVNNLFDVINQDADREFLLRMSYMEIYNEEINDLLVPEHRKLQIHESLERGIYVAGLREEIVASSEQVLDLMEFGESHRHIGETNMNLYSSRSHTIFRMIIESRDKVEDGEAGNSCDAVRVSVLNLVDLAGSERAAKTGAEGIRLKEGSHINKSLMTLGTVIKKLSEGAESQGSHVPYRDSKLTRILQPALGGNANTAIICNITLAQVHADETKSTLQFASRALRVTNCAHVNEILTDAALLKRQKREIEDLRAKLQGSHSEHLEEEILNLRNTLLKIELERERMALELEEEKKVQSEWEKRVQEQAKKIENLSSMVLYSKRDENHDEIKIKKDKRRDTWCPGNISRNPLKQVYPTNQSMSSAVKPVRSDREMGPLLPFKELLDDTEVSKEETCKRGESNHKNGLEGGAFPDPCALLHVTNRRKGVPKKKSLPGDTDVIDVQAAYEDLLLRFESEKTMSDIKIDCLTRKLAEIDDHYHVKRGDFNGDKHISLRESEAILVIKRLQERILTLEVEKSSSQQNLDNVVELATEQNICAREKFDELSEELHNAREEARVAREKLNSPESEERFDLLSILSMELQEVTVEIENSKQISSNVSLLINDTSQCFSALSDMLVDLKTMIHKCSVEQKLIINDHEELNSQLMQKVSKIENEKLLLQNYSDDLQNQIELLKQQVQNNEELSMALDHQNMEQAEFLAQIQVLQKEITCLSSSSLAREKESLRKDLEKTKGKLKEFEVKLKNALQERTKLEGEKAAAEREIKRLVGQNSLLKRDINKRDSIAGRRRDSIIDKSSKGLDPDRAKSFVHSYEQILEEDQKKLEVFAFELEAKIASLEEQLRATYNEKEEAIFRNECLLSELETLTEKLQIANIQLTAVQDVNELKESLEEATFKQKNLESSIRLLEEQKEELAMQLTEALLEMEEERAVWLSKEKTYIEAIEEKVKLHDLKVASASKEISKVMNDLESCREECELLKQKLRSSEENERREKECSQKKLDAIESLKNEKNIAEVENEATQQNIRNQLLLVTKERDDFMIQIQDLQSHSIEVELLKNNTNEMLVGAKLQAEKLASRISSLEVKMHDDEVQNGKEKAKLRMRLRRTQAKLDAFRIRYQEALDESDLMDRKYEKATKDLKKKLASECIENLNLRKQLASVQGL